MPLFPQGEPEQEDLFSHPSHALIEKSHRSAQEARTEALDFQIPGSARGVIWAIVPLVGALSIQVIMTIAPRRPQITGIRDRE